MKRLILGELVGLICTDPQNQTVVPANALTDVQVEQYFAQYITAERYPDTWAFVHSLEMGTDEMTR